MSPLDLLKLPFSYVVGLYHWWRYGARIAVALDWKNPMIWVHGGMNEISRAVRIDLTAPRQEELHITQGTAQVRVGRRWQDMLSFDSVFTMPWTVGANREDSRMLRGSSLARALAEKGYESGTVRIRIVLRRPHGRKIMSKALELTTQELEQKTYR
jgi:hypothetical protein